MKITENGTQMLSLTVIKSYVFEFFFDEQKGKISREKIH